MSTTSPSKRKSKSKPAAESAQQESTTLDNNAQKPIHEILSLNHAANREKGWRAKDLGVDKQKRSELFRKLLLFDFTELKGYLSGRPDNMHAIVSKKSGKFIPRDTKFNPKSVAYLCYAWGVGENHPNVLLKLAKVTTKLPPKKANPRRHGVIENYEAAKIQFSPRSLFIQHRVEAQTVLGQDNNTLSKEALREARHVAREEAKAEWVLLSDENKAEWEAKSQYYLQRQPFIKDEILELIRADPSKSWEKIAEDLGHWCSKKVIRAWFYTLPDSIKSIKPSKPTKEQQNPDMYHFVPVGQA